MALAAINGKNGCLNYSLLASKKENRVPIPKFDEQKEGKPLKKVQLIKLDDEMTQMVSNYKSLATRQIYDNKPIRALSALDTILRIKPNDLETVICYAGICSKCSFWPRGLKVLEKANQFFSKDKTFSEWLDEFRLMNRFLELEKLYQANPKDAKTIIDLVLICEKLDEIFFGLEILTQAVKDFPEDSIILELYRDFSIEVITEKMMSI